MYDFRAQLERTGGRVEISDALYNGRRLGEISASLLQSLTRLICTDMPHPSEGKTTHCEERVTNAYTHRLIKCRERY